RPTFIVEVRGPKEQVMNLLEATDGVDSVKADSLGEGLTNFEVKPSESGDLRETIFARVSKNGWSIRRLDLRRPKLEDHFIELVLHDADAADTEEKEK